MANGDQAAQAGLEVFMKSEPVRNGYDCMNIRGDELANHILNGGHSWQKISNKPSKYPPESHKHSWSQITGKPSKFPVAYHTHGISDINGGRWTGDIDTAWNIKTSANYTGRNAYLSDVYNHNLSSSYRSVYVTSTNGSLGYVGSSRELKNLLEDYEVDLDKWLSLTPRLYAYKDDPQQSPRAGFFAEDVNEDFPEYVQHTEGVPDGLHYEAMVAALHSVCQQQQDLIDVLASRINALETRIERAEGKLEPTDG